MRRWSGIVAGIVVALVVGCTNEATTPLPDPPVEDPIAPCTAVFAPRPVANTEFYPAGLALDDDNLYLADFFTDLSVGGGNIYRVPKAGGALTPLYQVDGVRGFDLRRLVYHGGALFWIEESYADGKYIERIRTMPAAGGTASDVAAGEYVQFVVDDDYTYLARRINYDQTIIDRVPHGGAPEQIASMTGQSYELEADATHLYGAMYSQGIWRLPKAGGDATFIVPGGSNYQQLLPDTERLYRFDGEGNGTITSFAKTGDDGHELEVPHLRDGWRGARLAGDDFFLTSYAAIARLPKTGGSLAPIVCPGDGFEPFFVAADATRVFLVAFKKGYVGADVWVADR